MNSGSGSAAEPEPFVVPDAGGAGGGCAPDGDVTGPGDEPEPGPEVSGVVVGPSEPDPDVASDPCPGPFGEPAPEPGRVIGGATASFSFS